MEKGVIRVAGDSEYRIAITYTKEHGRDCVWCTIMRDHETAPVSGIQELGKAVTEILEYFSHDIVNSELYSHCERIGVTVERQHGTEWHCDAQYEITKK